MRHMTQALRPMAVVFSAFLILAALAVVAPVATAQDQSGLTERALGSPDAPVTMIEFSSLTCPHCADFHTETLPKLKEQYIDTGKLRLVFRDFPLDPLAMGAAMLAHCVQPDRYFGFLDALFRSQSTWAGSQQPIEELERLSRFAGLGKAEFQACLENRELMEALQQQAQTAKAEHDIQSTPTFIIEDERIEGALPFEEFQSVIDDKLGEEAAPQDAFRSLPEALRSASLPAADVDKPQTAASE